MYIEKINEPQDLKKLNVVQMEELADEIRQLLLKKLSKKGGHFGPNFGMVEATIAMHYVFESPEDKIVFDVSHQSYTHKILTGRKEAFLKEENYGDVTGYSNPLESPHDLFTIGHTSTSISLASGIVKARDLKGEKYNVIAVIGDGSLGGGEALEGLNFAGEQKTNFIIVVNDNDMSIAENHGGMYKNLKLLRDTDGQAQCNLFKAMGTDYVYVKEGNNIEKLIEVFKQVKDSNKPVVVHINTLKGKGYSYAENDKEKWHYCSPFDIATGQPVYKEENEDYSDLTWSYLSKKIKEDKSVVAITAATPTVMGFTKERRIEAGSQFVDVGIAEETAVALASGIAAGGGKPVLGVYSTFLQRAYDQISQDVCINNSPVTMVVYDGSVYGMSDITHLGFQDIPMLSNIPGLVYMAPATKEEFAAMLDYSIEQNKYPVAIKVPGGPVISDESEKDIDFSNVNKYKVVREGKEVAILGLGTFFNLGKEVAQALEEAIGIKATVINPYYISGTDRKLLNKLKENHRVVVTIEDGILDGGFGQKIASYYGDSSIKVLNYGFKKEFLDRYNVNQVLEENRITKEQITEDILRLLDY